MRFLKKLMMKASELKIISESLIETFNKAGKISIELYKKGLEIKIKEDKSPVSNGDLKVNELITNKITELTPNIPVISEETVDLKIKNKAKIFWLIDPIDGTRSFVTGNPTWSNLISLNYKNKPMVGLANFPKLKKYYLNENLNKAYVFEQGKKSKS